MQEKMWNSLICGSQQHMMLSLCSGCSLTRYLLSIVPRYIYLSQCIDLCIKLPSARIWGSTERTLEGWPSVIADSWCPNTLVFNPSDACVCNTTSTGMSIISKLIVSFCLNILNRPLIFLYQRTLICLIIDLVLKIGHRSKCTERFLRYVSF